MTLLSMWLAISCIAAAALVELVVAWDLATPLGLREHTITVYDTPPAQPDGRVMRITDWRGVQHECDLGSSKPRPSAAAQDLDGAWDLLDRDANATCSKLDLGWFTLELCYGERVRQFHEVCTPPCKYMQACAVLVAPVRMLRHSPRRRAEGRYSRRRVCPGIVRGRRAHRLGPRTSE